MLYNDSLNCFTDSRDIFEWADKNNHINFVCEEQIYYENLCELKISMLKESNYFLNCLCMINNMKILWFHISNPI